MTALLGKCAETLRHQAESPLKRNRPRRWRSSATGGWNAITTALARATSMTLPEVSGSLIRMKGNRALSALISVTFWNPPGTRCTTSRVSPPSARAITLSCCAAVNVSFGDHGERTTTRPSITVTLLNVNQAPKPCGVFGSRGVVSPGKRREVFHSPPGGLSNISNGRTRRTS